jgi:DNA recombination protein RmuC
MVDKQLAVQMIDLVLQTDGKHAVGFLGLGVAVAIEIVANDPGRPLDLFPDVGHRQAAFLVNDGFLGRPGQRGIDEGTGIAIAVFLIDVHDDDAFGHPNLHRGQPDAVGLVHSLQHVVDQPADTAVDLVDFGGNGFQFGVGRDKNGADGHGFEIECPRTPVKIEAMMEILLAVATGILALTVAFLLLRRRPDDPRLDTVIAAQGRIDALLAQAAAKVETLDKRLGDSLTDNTAKTQSALAGLGERLAVIDSAQKNIAALSGQMVSLQEVLSNKQSRGAFGQAQMEDIVRDGLPASLYEFQAKLSNGLKPDCLIRIPGASAAMVIDAKFPLEGFSALRAAATDEARKTAAALVRTAVAKHVSDIAGKYLIPGETQSPAIMFVPSESIYADLYENFPDVIQKAHRAQVIIVSPNILMLAINTIQTVMKDARMREQASLIQKEVGALIEDVKRLDERVRKLQNHFSQADSDIRTILISTDKISGRGEKIAKVELSPAAETSKLS